MSDVTDDTFEEAVLVRSDTVPVVVDLWAPWCGPCKTLGPMLEAAVAATDGKVELAKVNVDDNQKVSAAFQVQSIPAVFAIVGRQVVDGFVGALPQAEITAFVQKLAPAPSEADLLVIQGDEESLRKALEIERDHLGAVVGLARLLVADERAQEALTILARIPETDETRQIAAEARLAAQNVEVPDGGVGLLLDALLDQVKGDEDARQEFLDLLATLAADDPQVPVYRKALSARLF